MSAALTIAEWSTLAEIARRSGESDLADRVLIASTSDPLVVTMRDVVDEIRGMRQESREGFERLSREIHELRDSSPPGTPVPLPPSSVREPVTSRMWSVVEDNPRNAAIVLLLALSIIVGGPQTVGRLMDYALGPVPEVQTTVTIPVPAPMPMPVPMSLEIPRTEETP